uniref:Membrane progestin receptor beta-like n=2 Tax=Ciona intestinalis TaxID=7719 RepID=F6VJ60_CIOIN|nr:membrane progestin receptor beta-like isoform X1 [Ciona intestinalis]XP_026693936.1 membrane progestin receptor beta-like isoform X2 [Ciona intestinalis]|eukprot:XP_026693935.1 membrane progestin receptor beta-like isoform X1 [Ciona intestinalis]
MAYRNLYLSQYLPRSFQKVADDVSNVGVKQYLYQNYVTGNAENNNNPSLNSSNVIGRLSCVTSYFQNLVKSQREARNSEHDMNEGKMVDPDDYFHALKNSCNNVPQCCVEPYILKGYVLPHMPLRYYFKVLYIPNNELFNVWTHLFPCLFFISMLYQFNQSLNLFESWPVLIVTVSAILLTLCSSLAHLFHSRSSFQHCCWFMVDYFGITTFAYSSTVSHFFASSQLSYYNRIGWLNLLVFTLIACCGFLCMSFTQAGNRWQSVENARKMKLWSTVFGYLYGMLPIMHRYLINAENDHALYYHKLQFICMLLCPLFYTSDLPQKLWPGKFDIVGHSHQIFHVFAALSCYFEIVAIHMDVTDINGPWNALKHQNDFPTFELFCTCALALIVYCIILAIYIARSIHADFIEEIPACQCSDLNKNHQQKKVD